MLVKFAANALKRKFMSGELSQGALKKVQNTPGVLRPLDRMISGIQEGNAAIAQGQIEKVTGKQALGLAGHGGYGATSDKIYSSENSLFRKMSPLHSVFDGKQTDRLASSLGVRHEAAEIRESALGGTGVRFAQRMDPKKRESILSKVEPPKQGSFLAAVGSLPPKQGIDPLSLKLKFLNPNQTRPSLSQHLAELQKASIPAQQTGGLQRLKNKLFSGPDIERARLGVDNVKGNHANLAVLGREANEVKALSMYPGAQRATDRMARIREKSGEAGVLRRIVGHDAPFSADDLQKLRSAKPDAVTNSRLAGKTNFFFV